LTWDKIKFREMTFFRDYLIKYPDLAKEYSTIKKKASKESNNQKKRYLEIKTPFVKKIILRARKEFK
jgi:GrpB-like predicted nucleotidyltransferase (UPF0157 family)